MASIRRTGLRIACVLPMIFIRCEETGPVGGSKDITLPAVRKLVGAYRLDHFRVAYDDGKSLSDASPDVAFSGNMTITEDNRITQDVTVNNITVHMTAEIVSTPDDSTLRVSSQKKTYNIRIRFTSPTLVTVMDAHPLGGAFIETDTWTRTSTKVLKRPDRGDSRAGEAATTGAGAAGLLRQRHDG